MAATRPHATSSGSTTETVDTARDHDLDLVLAEHGRCGGRGETVYRDVTDTDQWHREHPPSASASRLAVNGGVPARTPCTLTTVDSSHASCTTHLYAGHHRQPEPDPAAYGGDGGPRVKQRLGDGVRQHGHHDTAISACPPRSDMRRRDDVHRTVIDHTPDPVTPTGSVGLMSSRPTGGFQPDPVHALHVNTSTASCTTNVPRPRPVGPSLTGA